MNSAIERLLTLRVSDVMNKRVVSISSTDTMEHAAQTLLEHSISGAPVLNERLRCAGMLSAIDFVKKQGGKTQGNGSTQENHETPEPVRIVECDKELVCKHMTPNVQSIAASQPLLSAARMMCDRHIHRLPVLDENCRPVGIITASDVVAALVNAIDE